LRQLLVEDTQSTDNEECDDATSSSSSSSSNHRNKRSASEMSNDISSLENMAALQVLSALDSGTLCAGPAVDTLLWEIILECLRLPVVASNLVQSSPPCAPVPRATKQARTTDSETTDSETTDSETRDSLLDLFDRSTVTLTPEPMSTEFALLLVTHPSIKHLSPGTLSKLMLGTGSNNLQILLKFANALEENVDGIRKHHVKLEAKDESLMGEVLKRLRWVQSKNPKRCSWDLGMDFGIGTTANSKTARTLLSKLSEIHTLIIQRYQTITGSTFVNSEQDSDSYEYPSSEDD
jgi:hypothetical protein